MMHTQPLSTNPQYLSLRLSDDDSRLIEFLHAQSGLSKSEVVKKSLRLMADQLSKEQPENAFTAGTGLFGRHGDAQRQSANIKHIVRQRLSAKHSTQAARP